MIELLKNDDIIEKVGGRFKLTSLIQKRWLELMRGARPLVDPAGKTEMRRDRSLLVGLFRRRL